MIYAKETLLSNCKDTHFFENKGSHPTNNTPLFYPSLSIIVRCRKEQNAMAANSKRKQEALLEPPVDDYHNSK